MSDTINVEQVYIKTLEEAVLNLTKNKLILDTNVSVLNSVCEQKDKQLQELNKRNFDLNESFGSLQTQHQEQIENITKDHEKTLAEFHANCMQEVEKSHREKNEALTDVWNRFNNLQIEYDLMTSRYEIATENLERKTKEYEIISMKYNSLYSEYNEFKKNSYVEKPEIKITKKETKKNKSEKNLSSF